jgi:hypothetical protein
MNKQLRKSLKRITFKWILKRITFKWGFLNNIDPLQDKSNLIKALDMVHKTDKSMKTDMLKNFYYYTHVNQGGK